MRVLGGTMATSAGLLVQEIDSSDGAVPIAAPPLPSLSMVIPATDGRDTLGRCLLAIEAGRAHEDQVIVVRQAPRPGPASARNDGAGAATNSVLVFVDADIEIRPDALDRIRQHFAEDPQLAAVFGSYDDDPEELGVVSTFRNLLHHSVHHECAGTVDSFWAGLGAVRRDVFDAVGGFDASIARASVEDIELGSRLSSAGRVVLDPRIQGKHLKRWTLAGMLYTDLRRRGVPWTTLALRGRATRRGLNLAMRHRLSAATCVLFLGSLIRGRLTAACRWLTVLCVVNRRFYRLLATRGRRYVVPGVALHVIHHLTSVTALAIGTVEVTRSQQGPRRR